MRSVRARLRLYVPSDIDEEVREETTKLIEEAADRIEALEAALKEAGEMWVRKDNRIEALEAALRGVRQELWVDHCLHAGRTDIDPRRFNSAPHIRIIDDALAPERDK